MTKDPYVIDRPELQSPLQRVAGRGITFIFWVIWLYLWLPLISLLAWWLGFTFFKTHLIDNNGYIGLFEIIDFYLLVIFILGIALIGWARYNYFRFRKKLRRKNLVQVDLSDQAHRFGVEPQKLAGWQKSKHLKIYHDTHGQISRVEAVDSHL